MIKKFTFNKKKKETIVLIHGLHTTSGFWLTYFKLFKDYKIIAYDFNYVKILEDELQIQRMKEILGDLDTEENIVGIISHSLGTLISDFIFQDKNFPIFKICPIAFSNRSNTEGFISDVAERTNLSEGAIKHSMELVDQFRLSTKDLSNTDGFIYTPDDDTFFNYDIASNKNNEFNGNHFEIGNAIEDIILSKLKYT